jgi:hypothetical protein
MGDLLVGAVLELRFRSCGDAARREVVGHQLRVEAGHLDPGLA